MSLLDDSSLACSEVVANAAMNRGRGLDGPNSYSRDLSFDVFSYLLSRFESRGYVAWLDLCCGSGRALVQAGERLVRMRRAERVRIVGVDLVPMFEPVPAEVNGLVQLVGRSIAEWSPDREFDLITCVHGLHYVGDKAGVVGRACSRLAEDGLFVAHLDPANLHLEGAGTIQPVLRALRECGVRFDSRKRLARCEGRREVALPFVYLGADDEAGPNSTGQPAVTSHYAPAP